VVFSNDHSLAQIDAGSGGRPPHQEFRTLASQQITPKPLVLLCHFLIHFPALLAQAARAPGQRGDEADGELTADSGD
jgi:hypothetical protein